jgi:hypothetical protein
MLTTVKDGTSGYRAYTSSSGEILFQNLASQVAAISTKATYYLTADVVGAEDV